MELSEISALTEMSQRRFRNFADAAASLLESLRIAVPGTIALARAEPDGESHRVLEVRGENTTNLAPGSIIRPTDHGLEPAFLSSVGAQAALTAPLEMSDGKVAGLLFAVGRGPNTYGPQHAVQLGVAARLLAHEWESVMLRSELRRLRGRAGPNSNGELGSRLLDSDAFMVQLDREWRLALRATVESVLVVCHIAALGDEVDGADGRRRLAVEQVGELLSTTARTTDPVGRVDETSVAAVLVGCPEAEAGDFIGRLRPALDLVAEQSGHLVEVSCGIQPLARGASPEEVLGRAQRAAGAEPELALASEGSES
jgi:hypothetical protein